MQSINNRNATYLAILENLPKQRRKVYEAIKLFGVASVQKIAEYLNCDPSDISGRFTELKNCFLIKEVSTVKSNKSKNKVVQYTLTTDDERIDLVNKKFVELKNKKDALIQDQILHPLCEYSQEVITNEIAKIETKIKNLEKVAL
jgi:predicted transcriptional regulator